MMNLKKKIAPVLMGGALAVATAVPVFASDAGTGTGLSSVETALTTSFTSIGSSMISVVGKILPIALPIMGTLLLVGFGIKAFKKIANKAEFIFVSNCLHNEFQKYVRLSDGDLKGHVHIINNSVGKVFEDNSYKCEGDKKYDFITIRNNMDSSTYCIDLVCKLAEKNQNFSFLVIGKGNFFKNKSKPDNITWIDEYLNHEDILNCVNQARCALMLTRRDTQGVMSCELVTYGIPLITSDLPVCREIFEKIPSVAFMNNEVENENFSQIYVNILKEYRTKIDKFGYGNTVEREENIIKMEY